MGLRINKTIFSPGGRPFQVSHGAHPIKEIIA